VLVSVISVGNELLNGDTLNTNLAYLGERLADAGVPLHRETCVPDDREAIRAALSHALIDSAAVITIGGLGPTTDDLTRTVVAETLGLALHEDPDVAAAIRAYLARCAVSIPPEAIRLQSLVPAAAQVLPNPNGTAPGLCCQRPGQATVIMLPGPPAEFRPMVDDAVLPRLLQAVPPSLQRPRVVRVAGLAESRVEACVQATLLPLPGLQVAYCAKPGCVTVRLSDPCHRADLLDTAATRLRQAFAALALPPDCLTPADHVAQLLQARGWYLAAAESCTGGLVAAAATDIPGSSAWFAGALVTYSNEWKQTLLGVRQQTLDAHGAVSEAVVREMLAVLRARFGVRAAIAISGIAGPAGATPDKPVGTVCVGVCADAVTTVTRLQFPGNRHSVRERATAMAFVLLRTALLQPPASCPPPVVPLTPSPCCPEPRHVQPVQ
jgi:nicotinamide-nucleotide amidase